MAEWIAQAPIARAPEHICGPKPNRRAGRLGACNRGIYIGRGRQVDVNRDTGAPARARGKNIGTVMFRKLIVQHHLAAEQCKMRFPSSAMVLNGQTPPKAFS
jgi:hypothetical protein